jgi:hypothetical protein
MALLKGSMRTAMFRLGVIAGVLALGAATSAAMPSNGPGNGSIAAPNGSADQKPAKDAPAATKAKAEIIVLHATNDHKGIDPKIGKMPELAKPPFSAYDTYKLLDKFDFDLVKGEAPKAKKLPDRGNMTVALKDIVPAAEKGKPARFILSATIEKPEQKKFLPALEVNAVQNEYFFIAGQKYEGGILVIGIRVPNQ